MLAQKPPMGWNSWNSFTSKIDEKLILETVDAMIEKDYRDAGYEYVVIDDCWAEHARNEKGEMVPDKEKFPHGMKYIADYIHSKGMKFGMYSCAGACTCAGYPGSYGYEYIDAKTFASWDVDYLKYDFCSFPQSGDCKTAYLTMSSALRASGREILFSACNWGQEEPWKWMRSIGAHMYRSTGDIFDHFTSVREIIMLQSDKFYASAPGCHNDIDMMIAGMYGNGNVGFGEGNSKCSDVDYETHFALWCMFSAPLIIGGDVRNMNDFCHKLLTNPELIAINQDEECRNPYILSPMGETLVGSSITYIDKKTRVMIKVLSNNEFALGLFNLGDTEMGCGVFYEDIGIPISSGAKPVFKEILGSANVNYGDASLGISLKPHECKLIKYRIEI